jgi:hypothetical protein
MRLEKLALGAAAVLGAVGLTGAAAAATQNTSQNTLQNGHVLTVQLPGGGAAHILYFGDTPPRVRLEPAGAVSPAGFSPAGWPGPMAGLFDPAFPAVDQVMAEMDHRADLMLAQARQMMSPAPGGDGLMHADFSHLPPGVRGYSMVSTMSSQGGCMRTVEYRSTGNGPAQVTRKTSGNCAAESAPIRAASAIPAAAAAGQPPLRLTSVSYRPAP